MKAALLFAVLLFPTIILAGDPATPPSAKEIEYRKCLAAVGPRQTWAPGFEGCPDIIRNWRANNPKTTW